MHASELAQLAVVVASSAAEFIYRPRPLAGDGLKRYWTLSQCRLERWGIALHDLAHHAHAHGSHGPAASDGPGLPPVLEEILVSDLLTRVWTAVAIAHDRARDDMGDAEPTARGILTAHEEARQRTLHVILESASLRAEQAVKLNRLRRRIERWNDVIISHLLADLPFPALAQLAFDPQAAAHTAARLVPYPSETQRNQAWENVRSSLTISLTHQLARPAEAELNTQIAAAVVASLGPEFADTPGLPEFVWRLRLENAASQMHTMVEELLAIELSAHSVVPPREDK